MMLRVRAARAAQAGRRVGVCREYSTSCPAKNTILEWCHMKQVNPRYAEVEHEEVAGMETKERELEGMVVEKMMETDMDANAGAIPPPVRSLPCLTEESVRGLLQQLKEGGRIPLIDAMQVLSAASLLFRDEETVRHVDGAVVVVGDLHGSLGDLLHILDVHGLPGEERKYIFNGDLVDRGNNSCEVLLLVLILKLSTPDAVHINRGNHEDGRLNARYGFYDECIAKYNLQFFDYCVHLFSWLPLGAVVNRVAFVCHGGAFEGSIDNIRRLPRGPNATINMTEEEKDMLESILWSDPTEGVRTKQPSHRGAGWEFGAGVSIPWLKANKLMYLIRSHQCKSRDGLAVNHRGKVFTVFSASNYYWPLWPSVRTSAYPNDASVLVFDEQKEGDPHWHVPAQYTWEPTLLPVDNPINSAPQVYTGEPFQLTVPDSRLEWRGDRQEVEFQKVMHALSQRAADLHAALAKMDPAKTGKVKVDAFERLIAKTAKYLPRLHNLRTHNFIDDDCVSIDYKAYLEEFVGRKGRQHVAPDWHAEILRVYTAHMESQGRIPQSGTGMRLTLRKIFPEEYFSNDQLASFVDSYLKEPRPLDDRPVVKLEWAVDRRTERVNRMRARLSKVPEDELQRAFARHAITDVSVTQDGVLAALHEVGTPVSADFVSDLVEQLGRRRTSLDTPGLASLMHIEQLMAALKGPKEKKPNHVCPDVAIGLSQTFLITIHKCLFAENASANVSVDLFKNALVALNKANNFPLTSLQIETIVRVIDSDNSGMIDTYELKRVIDI
eukprot:TRINITY_DN879_c1_g1_i1.p1 TRINITY_DN879_c1_g1~~TRINITY_DN879_c1_g1_i1.p1  ORF type:complete len:779 (+),score=283.26 TRINITY_DN879_c1_g1_i1:90-2426(+)